MQFPVSEFGVQNSKNSRPPFDRPLRTMFLLTSMPVGGAETLLVNLVRRFERKRILPFVGCLKQKDELGERISREVKIFDKLIRHKFDVGVIKRLKAIFEANKIDALITIGAGDKMFWGRIAARQSRLPVVLSALHSTGWPDGVGRLNRMLTGITDGFIAVARQHAEYQINVENFPANKVFLIPNGIDTEQFQFNARFRSNWRRQLEIPETAPVVGIVAALRPEKNHVLFLQAAKKVHSQMPDAHFVIAGDGPERETLEAVAADLNLLHRVHFLGSVQDVVGVLSMIDVFSLTSQNEASPVSILEALSCQRPVVAPAVGSVNENVLDGRTGFLYSAGDVETVAQQWVNVLKDESLREEMGMNGREHVVEHASLERMTLGYTQLIEHCYANKMDVRVKKNLYLADDFSSDSVSQQTASNCQ